MTMCATFAASNGARMPRVAPPAPSTSKRALARTHAMVLGEIAHQARAIGVVGKNPAFARGEKIRGARHLRAIAALIRPLERVHLERQRHVGALAAFTEKTARVLAKISRRNEQPIVFERFARGARERRVDRGRKAVGNRGSP
jgi:hypothetical protein